MVTKEQSPFNISLGTYDGTIIGVSSECDDSNDYETPLTLKTNFATSTHASAVRSIAQHGSLLATGGADEVIHLYDIQSRIELGTFVHHDSTVTSLNFADDNGRTLLFSTGGKGDSAICIWHRETLSKNKSEWTPLRRLEGHAPDTGGIRDVGIHPSTRICLSVADDRSLFMWNLKKGKIAFSVKTKQLVKTVSFSPLGTKYLLGSEQGILTLSDTSGKNVNTFLCGSSAGDIQCASFMNEDVVVSGSDDGVVRLWDSRGKEENEPQVIMKHSHRLSGIDIVDGLVVAADSGGGLKIWDMRMTGEPRIETDMATKARITCMTAGHKILKPSPYVDDDDRFNQVEGGTKASKKKDNKKRQPEQKEAQPEPKLEGTASQRKRKKRKEKEQE